MQEMVIHLAANLPEFSPREPVVGAEAGMAERAWSLLTQVYAERQRLDGFAPGAVASLYYPAAVAFTDGEGAARVGYAAAIGPMGEGPRLTIFISNDRPPAATVCAATRGWIDFYGGVARSAPRRARARPPAW